MEKTIETENAILQPKLVGKIEGKFIVPAYQRGYRWQSDNVRMLLDDIIHNGDNSYCLQPVVVKGRSKNEYELIDGQQRLTTLFLILKYIQSNIPKVDLKFALSYETRTKSEEFLNNLDSQLANENIDFYHIHNAYNTIQSWFENDDDDALVKSINIYRYLGESVKVIWYEMNTKELSDEEAYKESVALFTRLNIGKIPLTNAELVKALFLANDKNDISDEKQLEISTSWDLIERELQDNDLWSFLTNQSPEKFATRIELIFDLMAQKPKEEREEFFTFFYFSKLMESESKIEIWKNIQTYFLRLKEWYEKRDLYHKIGFLIASGAKLHDILNDSADKTKKQFEKSLDEKIIKMLNLSHDDISDLSYDNKTDNRKIDKVLLLFNVETTRLLKNSSEKYSFSKYKKKKWSLEHIHAQNSEGLIKKEDQQTWLQLHKQSLENLSFEGEKNQAKQALISKINESYDRITGSLFKEIFNEVFDVLSENSDRTYMDSIGNMALLSMNNNAALNNSTFDVKRNRILDMDRNGEYIPICTRRVFLKYYSDSDNHHVHFWGESDRKAYLNAMIGSDGVLAKYLKTSTENNF